jgi:hypothetical protein
MLRDAQIQVAGDPNVKSAYVAAEKVDGATGHSKMPAFLVSAPGKDCGASAMNGLVVEKPGAAWVKQAPSESFDCAPLSAVSRDESVRRSAQDDGFVWGLVLYLHLSMDAPGSPPAIKFPEVAILSQPEDVC